MDEQADSFGGPIGHATDHHAAIAVAAQHHIVVVFPFQDCQNVIDMV
nr:hypothetical protein [Marinobacter salicampi]